MARSRTSARDALKKLREQRAQLDGEEAVPFMAPVPLREQLAAAMSRKAP